MHASENGHPEVVMLLLTHPGIDINLQDKVRSLLLFSLT